MNTRIHGKGNMAGVAIVESAPTMNAVAVVDVNRISRYYKSSHKTKTTTRISDQSWGFLFFYAEIVRWQLL